MSLPPSFSYKPGEGQEKVEREGGCGHSAFDPQLPQGVSKKHELLSSSHTSVTIYSAGCRIDLHTRTTSDPTVTFSASC